jgi:hypothetical protein
MGKTNAKGEIGEAMILADLQRQGHGIAIPFGHDLPFDLIVVRKENAHWRRSSASTRLRTDVSWWSG